MFIAGIALCLDMRTFLDAANETVVYPKNVFIRSLNASMIKYTSGVNITHEELYQQEMTGGRFFDGTAWSLYSPNQTWVAELSKEFAAYQGLDELEGSVPLVEQHFREFASAPKVEGTLEYPSYQEYIEYVFSDEYAAIVEEQGPRHHKRGTVCGLPGRKCILALGCNRRVVSGVSICACYGTCLQTYPCSDGIC